MKWTTEDEMVGRHHRLHRNKFDKAPGVGDEQGGLACCSPWGWKQLHVTELNHEYLLTLHSIPGKGNPPS